MFQDIISRPKWCTCVLKKTTTFILMTMCCLCANADDITLDDALRNTYASCVGIDDTLHDIKVKAGINTAITAVGTVAGGGALIVGIKKARMNKLNDIEDKYNTENMPSTGNNITITVQPGFKPNLKSKKKKLGNWRTGLLAANVATNVAGAAIAGTNKVGRTLEENINGCKSSVQALRNAIVIATAKGEDVSEAKEIASACGEFEYIDLGKINNRAKGAEIFSIAGGGVGAAGVATSVVANKSSGEKEKKLDTASNVLAGGATVLTGTATVFNALQITTIKKVVSVAQKCESSLK